MQRTEIGRAVAVTGLLLLWGANVSFAQAPGWSREEVAARERAALESEGIKYSAPKQDFGAGIKGDILSLGTRTIDNRRTDVRGHSGRGESAMLRYDQHRDLTPPKDATISLGPWYTDVILHESVGVQYITMDGSGVDFITKNGRGRYQEDGFDVPIISTLSFNNRLLLTRHMDFQFNIDLSYSYYPFGTQKDTWYVNMSDEGAYATFSTEIQLAKDMRLMLYDDMLYRTDYIDTRGMEDVYGGEEYEHFENTVGADYDWLLTARDNISASVSRRDIISFSDEFDDQEGYFYNEMVAYTRKLNAFASAGVACDMSQSYYNLDTRPDINMYGVTLFAVAQLTRTVVANASLGYSYSSTPDGRYGTGSSGDIEGSIGLGHQISEDRYQELRYHRSQREAFQGGVDVTDSLHYRYEWSHTLFPGSFNSDYTIYNPVGEYRNSYSDWMNSLELRHRLTREWELIFNTSYDMRMNDPFDNAGGGNPGSADVSSDYNTWVIHLGTGRNITRKTRFEIYAEHADRSSDNEDLEYTQDAIVASLNWEHKF